MGHEVWASDVRLSNIHEHSLFTSPFHLYQNTKVWKLHKNAFEPHFKIRILAWQHRQFHTLPGLLYSGNPMNRVCKRDQLTFDLCRNPIHSIIVPTCGPQTYVCRLWLIVLVNLGYSFNFHASLPLRVAMSQHCEEPGCPSQTLEGRSLIGYYVALFNVLISRFS